MISGSSAPTSCRFSVAAACCVTLAARFEATVLSGRCLVFFLGLVALVASDLLTTATDFFATGAFLAKFFFAGSLAFLLLASAFLVTVFFAGSLAFLLLASAFLVTVFLAVFFAGSLAFLLLASAFLATVFLAVL